MLKKFTCALILAAIFLSLVTEAEAGRKSSGGGSGGVSDASLGSGR